MPYVTPPGLTNTQAGALKGAVNGKGCSPSNLADNKKVLNDNPKSNMEAIAKTMNAKPECVKAATNSTSEFVTDSKVATGVVAPFFAAGAAAANSTANSTMDDTMYEKGCGAFSASANAIMASTRNIACTLQSTLVGQEMTVNAGAKITVRTVAPDPHEVKAIKDIMANNRLTRNDLIQIAKPEYVHGMPIEAYSIGMAGHKLLIKEMFASEQQFVKLNPIRAVLLDTNIDLKIESAIKLNSQQSFSEKAKTEIIRDMKNVALAKAVNKVSQDNGVRALSPETTQLISNKIDTKMESESANIMRKVINTTMKANSENEILISVAGPIIGSNIKVGILMQIEAQMQQAINSAVFVGDKAALEIKAEAAGQTENSTRNKGLDDLKKAQVEGMNKLLETSGKNQNKFFSSVFSGLGMLFLLPMIAGVAILMFFPNIVKGFIPPPVRYVLIGVLIFLIVAFMLGIFPFSSSSEDMKIQDSPKNLVYDVTDTKGFKKNNNMYRFKVDGDWKLN